MNEVPGYAGTLSGELGANVSAAVEMALLGFLQLSSRSSGSDPGSPLAPALDASYALGRGDEPEDRCSLHRLTTDGVANGHRLGSLVSAIVKSPAFGQRRAEGGTP